MNVAVLMEPVESVRGQFFSLTGIPHQPQKGLDQPGIVLQKEPLETVVGTQFRPVDRK